MQQKSSEEPGRVGVETRRGRKGSARGRAELNRGSGNAERLGSALRPDAAAARAAQRNKNADRMKLNISTSSEALTTARVVATEVPSIVGSAW